MATGRKCRQYDTSLPNDICYYRKKQKFCNIVGRRTPSCPSAPVIFTSLPPTTPLRALRISCTFTMQSGNSSETSASTRIYELTRRHIPEDFYLYQHRKQNLAIPAFATTLRLSILYVNVCRTCVLR
jgi:hypothetical protein